MEPQTMKANSIDPTQFPSQNISAESLTKISPLGLGNVSVKMKENPDAPEIILSKRKR
jgi:hypothetical protein